MLEAASAISSRNVFTPSLLQSPAPPSLHPPPAATTSCSTPDAMIVSHSATPTLGANAFDDSAKRPSSSRVLPLPTATATVSSSPSLPSSSSSTASTLSPNSTSTELLQVIKTCMEQINQSISFIGLSNSGRTKIVNALLETTCVAQAQYLALDRSAAAVALDPRLAAEVVLNLSLDERFEQAINWTIERRRIETLEHLWSRLTSTNATPAATSSSPVATIDDDEVAPFLLPPDCLSSSSALHAAAAATTAPSRSSTTASGSASASAAPIPQAVDWVPSVTIRYGTVPEVIVSFRRESDFPHAAFIHGEIRLLLGRKVRFRGAGKNIDVDRIFIREKIREIRAKYLLYADNFLIRIPSLLLRGNREFLLTATAPPPTPTLPLSSTTTTAAAASGAAPGTGATKSSSLLKQVVPITSPSNVVVVVVDQRGITPELRHFLASTRFLERIIRNPIDYKLQLVLVADSTLQPTTTSTTSSSALPMLSDSLVSTISTQFMAIIRELAPQPYTAAIGKVTSTIVPIVLQPRLYVSLCRSADARARLSESELRREQAKTGIPKLLYSIRNSLIAPVTNSIRSLHSACIDKYQYLRLRSPNTKAPADMAAAAAMSGGLTSSSDTVAALSRAHSELDHQFQRQFQALKHALTEGGQSIEIGLHCKALESYRRAAIEWADFRDQYMQTYEACRILLDPRYGGQCLGADLTSLTCSKLIEAAPLVWRDNVLSRMPDRLYDIMETSRNLLRQCVSVARANQLSVQSSISLPTDKLRLKKLIEFCEMVHKRTEQRVAEFRRTLLGTDATSVVHEACQEAVAEAILSKTDAVKSLRRYHDLMQDALPDVPTLAARKIRQRFASMLEASMLQLSEIERELHQSAYLVLVALNATPGDKEQQGKLMQQLADFRRQTDLSRQLATVVQHSQAASSVLSSGSTPSSTSNVAATGATSTPNIVQQLCSTETMKLSSLLASPSSSLAASDASSSTSDADVLLPPFLDFDPYQFSTNVWQPSMNLVNHERFTQQLATAGYTLLETPTDGTCLFRALAHQVYGTEEAYPLVRIFAINELLSNPREYEASIANGIGIGIYPPGSTLDRPTDLEEYVTYAANDSSWGDHIMLRAFGRHFGADILIFSPILEYPVYIPTASPSSSSSSLSAVPSSSTTIAAASASSSSSSAGTALVVAYTAALKFQSLNGPPKRISFRSDVPKSCSILHVSPWRRPVNSTLLRRTASDVDFFALAAQQQNDHHSIDSHASGNKRRRLGSAMHSEMDVTNDESTVPSFHQTVPSDRSHHHHHHHHLGKPVTAGATGASIPTAATGATALAIATTTALHDDGRMQADEDDDRLASSPPQGSMHIVSSSSVTPTGGVSLSSSLLPPMSLSSLSTHGAKFAKSWMMAMTVPRNDNRVRSGPNSYTAASLVSLCVLNLAHHIYTIPAASIAVAIPDELLHLLIRNIISRRGMCDLVITKLLSASRVSSLDLSTCKQLDYATCMAIARNGSSLRRLSLAGCINIPAEGIEQIANFCPQLEHLDVERCRRFEGTTMRHVAARCPRLQSLNATGCPRITDDAVLEICRRCPSLTSLELGECALLTDIALSELPVSLVRLDLSSCTNLTDRSVAMIAGRCKHIHTLRLAGRTISDDGVRYLANMCHESLVSLELVGCNISDAAVQLLAVKCQRLHTLRIPLCKRISAAAFGGAARVAATPPATPEQELARAVAVASSIAASPSTAAPADAPMALEHSLSTSAAASSTSASSLATAPTAAPIRFAALRVLDLQRCLELNDDALMAVIQACPRLNELDLSSCEEISDRTVVALAETYGPMLRCLNLSKCAQVTDVGISALARHCHRLRKLWLYNCVRVSDLSITRVIANCRELELLDLASCENVSDVSLQAFTSTPAATESPSRALPHYNLVELSLEESRITDSGLLMALRACPSLRVLKLAYCSNITKASIEQLARLAPHLRVLDISFCNQIDLDTVREALLWWRNMEELHLRGYHHITTDGIDHPMLHTLNLSWCKNIDDAAVAHIAKGCPSLVTLDLAWCGKITVQAVYQLVQECGALRELNLRGCTRLPTIATTLLRGAGITAAFH